MALPEPESRFATMSTPTPALIRAWACACWVVALPLALSMLQVRLYVTHCLLSSSGSAETQRGEDAVSGSRMPTFVSSVRRCPRRCRSSFPQPASPATSAAGAGHRNGHSECCSHRASFLIARGDRRGRRGSSWARVMMWSRASTGQRLCPRRRALVVRRCLVICICDIPHLAVVRVVPAVAIEGRAGAVRCRHGQHPRRLPAERHPAYRLAGMSNCDCLPGRQ